MKKTAWSIRNGPIPFLFCRLSGHRWQTKDLGLCEKKVCEICGKVQFRA